MLENILFQDPVSTAKWLGIFLGLAGLYIQLRRWEAKLSGKIDRIEIQQPLEVVPGKKVVTIELFEPVIHRVGALETEIRVIRTKMDDDKKEILAKIDAANAANQAGFRAIERAIGRLEGGQK